MALSPTTRTAATKGAAPAAKNQQGSRVSLIAGLEEGQTYSESIRLNYDEVLREYVVAEKNRLKSILSSASQRAAKRDGAVFTTEVGEFITDGGAVIVTAAVSRLS